MYKNFLTARSPLRLLEKGLHGGLGAGNLGLVVAGHGVGKSSFLVGVALDNLLRGARVLHIVIGRTVAHTRTHYDIVFDALAGKMKLEDAEAQRAEAARRRSIRAYPEAELFDAAKLAAAVDVERESGAAPALIIIEGQSPEALAAADLAAWRSSARELRAEIWVSVAGAGEKIADLPPALAPQRDAFAVILALEPAAEPEAVALRALKDHENPDIAALHVALDPKTLLLKRS